MLLKSKKDDVDDIFKSSDTLKPRVQTTVIAQSLTPSSKLFNDYDWDVVDEYDPLWPNEYEKLVKDKRDKDADKVRERNSSRDIERTPSLSDKNKRRGSRFNTETESSPPPAKFTSGFGGRPDDEDTYTRSPPTPQTPRTGGAAIAPPLSLQESTAIIPAFALPPDSKNVTVPYGSSSVAAKIMAKYGFKVIF